MKPQAIYHIKRDHYGQDSEKRETTLGIEYRPDGTKFGYTLEDVVRAYGIKRMKTTAIPATEGDFTYKMTVRKSPKYGKVVVIYTREENGMYYLEYGGISFQMILQHGGNHADHTDACVLTARNRVTEDGKMSIQGSLKDELVKEVEQLEADGYDVRLRITNLGQVG